MSRTTNKLALGARLLLGTIMFVFGLNGFLQFLPMPPLPDAAGAFMGALAASGYFFPLVKAVEVVTGLALLTGTFVPLALVVLAPISVNIFAFHLMLAPAGMAVPVLVVVLHLYLGWAYRNAFRGVLAAKARPASSGAASGGASSVASAV
ncbi:MAG: DoxX family protein [Myxococcales bacterium]|nr:DoxX family protein [Myxococcales bacterium]